MAILYEIRNKNGKGEGAHEDIVNCSNEVDQNEENDQYLREIENHVLKVECDCKKYFVIHHSSTRHVRFVFQASFIRYSLEYMSRRRPNPGIKKVEGHPLSYTVPENLAGFNAVRFYQLYSKHDQWTF